MDKKELLLKQCMDIFCEKKFRVSRYSVKLDSHGFRFETDFKETEAIHGSISISRKDVSIATCAKYRNIKNTTDFIKRLEDALDCCKRTKLLMVELDFKNYSLEQIKQYCLNNCFKNDKQTTKEQIAYLNVCNREEILEMIQKHSETRK